MAKSAFEIQMDYNKAVRQADSLLELARELENTSKRDFQSCISEISRSWTGENSNSYQSKCRQLQSKIETSAAQLRRTAETIKKIARNTYNAEMAALRLARLRKY